jgi:hypothetical protein
MNWKDVEGFESFYEVSDTGLLRRKSTQRILKPYTNKNGYVYVTLSVNGSQKSYRLHKLIAQAFVPNPDNKLEINHIDGCKQNNNATNLEWTDRSGNTLHAYAIGITKKPGETSIYRNVWYYANRLKAKKWGASISYEGNRAYGVKYFLTEEEAARHVDYLLDSTNNTITPRNFPVK